MSWLESQKKWPNTTAVSSDRNSLNCSNMEARRGWNFCLTSLQLLYKERMKDHGPHWATNLVHRRVNTGIGPTEKTYNSKMERNLIIYPSFSDMATGIMYPSANPCHKELVCYQTNQTPVHLFCMIGNKVTIFTSNFLQSIQERHSRTICNSSERRNSGIRVKVWYCMLKGSKEFWGNYISKTGRFSSAFQHWASYFCS